MNEKIMRKAGFGKEVMKLEELSEEEKLEEAEEMAFDPVTGEEYKLGERRMWIL